MVEGIIRLHDGADVPEEKTASIMINVGGGMEEAIWIMEAMAKAKEGKR